MNWVLWFIFIPQIWSFMTYQFTQRKPLSQFPRLVGFVDSVNRRVLDSIWLPEKPQGIDMRDYIE